MASYRVLIGCAPEMSSFNAGINLARLLAEHGHRPVFMGTGADEFKVHVEKNHFEYLSLVGDTLHLEKQMLSRNPVVIWNAAKGLISQLMLNIDQFAAGNQGQFDLAIVDITVPIPAYYLPLKLNIPIVVFAPNYASALNADCPPVFSSRIPGDSAGRHSGTRGKLRNLLAWTGVRMQELLPARLLISAVFADARQVVEQSGLKLSYGEWGVRADLPEIVLGHRDLDWAPLTRLDHRHYVAPRGVARSDHDVQWRAGLNLDGVLIYCNLSTLFLKFNKNLTDGKGVLLRRHKWVKQYLDTVVDVFRKRPDWQLVLSCGPFSELFEGVSLPQNVRIFSSVPQLDVLKHATVAITQGGAGTVRECAEAGVPMLVVPLWTDQYGNAARVVHHKLGLTLRRRDVTPQRIEELIERLIHDRDIRASNQKFANNLPDDVTEWEGLADFLNRHTSLRFQ